LIFPLVFTLDMAVLEMPLDSSASLHVAAAPKWQFLQEFRLEIARKWGKNTTLQSVDALP
jgi:hypothetical protein